MSLKSFKEFVNEVSDLHVAPHSGKQFEHLPSIQQIIVSQFIHVKFGTRGADTTGKYTAHAVDDLADVRQLLDVLSLLAQEEDQEFVMRGLEDIISGCSMFWLEDTSGGELVKNESHRGTFHF